MWHASKLNESVVHITDTSTDLLVYSQQGECTRCKQGYRLNGDVCEEIKAVGGAVCDKDSVCESNMCRNKVCCHSSMPNVALFNSGACTSCAPATTPTTKASSSLIGIGIGLLETTLPFINLDGGLLIGGLVTTPNPFVVQLGTTAPNVQAGYCNACRCALHVGPGVGLD